MAWFFIEQIDGDTHRITGEDAQHIIKSLRMACGEELTLCDRRGREYTCVIRENDGDSVIAGVLKDAPCRNEPQIRAVLYQALPKGDKMDFIVQKAVELGAAEIVPVITQRCISRPDKKAMDKKVQRWQKIARQAAQQSRRGIIPTVGSALSFAEAVKAAQSCQKQVLFYECGGKDIGSLLQKEDKSVAVFIGSEGGFAPGEVQQVLQNGGQAATLGKRILRAETAPLAALSVIMYATGNME